MEAISVKLSYNGSHRRFKIRGDNVIAMHSDLMNNVAQLTAHGLPVEIAWQDEDGDSVIISRAAELEEAIESRKDNLLRLHTVEKTNGNESTKSKEEVEKPSKAEDTPQNTPAGNEAVHGNVVCDVCDTPIIGTRYKCILCVDYDLCQNCERTGVHVNHGMVRIVDPMRTYVPWGARLRYTRRSGQHHNPHAPPTIDGVVHRLRMQEKKEQLTEQVVKGMQYLTEIGQVVTSALANFGIDASYEVQVDENKDEKKEDKTEVKQEEKKEETLRRKPELSEENKKEEAKLKPEPEIPVVKPDLPKDEPKKDALEKKDKSKKMEKKRDCLPSFRDFPYLQSAEADYRRATAKPADDSKKTTDCRCFITQMGYRQQRSEPCSACRRKLAKSKSAQSSSHSSFEHEEKPDIAFPDEGNKAKSDSEPVVVTPHVEELIEDKPIRRSRLCSSGSSSDSDFEALSYENFREEYENEKVTASAPQLSLHQSTVEPVTPPTTPPEVPDNSVPPTLYPELDIESVESARFQDQTIANRLIEMGFSAEEVFRVVKMHGCNFEKCLEEILSKGH